MTKPISSDINTATRCNEFVAMTKLLMQSRGDIQSACAMAEARNQTTAASILKSAVSPGTLADPQWGGALAPYKTLSDGFVGTLAAYGIWDRIWQDGAFKRIPLRTTISVITAAATASLVTEMEAKPTTRLTMASGGVLAEHKISAIIVISDELARSASSAAFSLLRSELQTAVTKATDARFVDVIAQETGGPVRASTGMTVAALVDDVNMALGEMELGPNSRVYMLAPSESVVTMSLMRSTGGGAAFPNLGINGGELVPGVVVLPSDALTDNAIILDATAFGADIGFLTLDSSNQASVQLDDSPTAEASTLNSLFQQGLTAIRVERLLGMTQLRATGACLISGFGVTA
jgi:hypothetical protein